MGGIRKRVDGVGSVLWAERFSRAVTPLSRLYRIDLDPDDFAPTTDENEDELMPAADETADDQRKDERDDDEHMDGDD